ncbi:MAG: putative DNA modification/repair radical SAM protein [Clostridiales bacterium]|jgi:putative DNA modification/repair radical SAM protein|nr:putative DNA modification/repair radical SAM protein [Clostridiales bacterium]
MEIMEKLRILADSAKYDVACTSSGVDRGARKGMLGSAVSCGICHSFAADGRCISLLKVLMTNYCVYDCRYCVNRVSNDVERAAFTPDELAGLMIDFYKRNYIEGLFLSSAVMKNPDYTMELLYKTLELVRTKYRFNGYVHVKAIPGASKELITAVGFLADRMSVNIELPSSQSLEQLAPDKTKESILAPMTQVKNLKIQNKEEVKLYRNAPKFVPAGQSTQLIVGATPEPDKKIITLAEGLYKKFALKRVFYSAYIPVPKQDSLPKVKPPLLREHRLYQADFLLRFYGFAAKEILSGESQNLNPNMDPKCQWAIDNISMFPVEVNKADYYTLLRVPGIGQISAKKITDARKTGSLDFDNLKKLGVVLKRARYFITCKGKMIDKISLVPEVLYMKLSENKINESSVQMSLFDLMPQQIETSSGGQFLYEEKAGANKTRHTVYGEDSDTAKAGLLIKNRENDMAKTAPLINERTSSTAKTALLIKEGAEIGWIGKAN